MWTVWEDCSWDVCGEGRVLPPGGRSGCPPPFVHPNLSSHRRVNSTRMGRRRKDPPIELFQNPSIRIHYGSRSVSRLSLRVRQWSSKPTHRPTPKHSDKAKKFGDAKMQKRAEESKLPNKCILWIENQGVTTVDEMALVATTRRMCKELLIQPMIPAPPSQSVNRLVQ